MEESLMRNDHLRVKKIYDATGVHHGTNVLRSDRIATAMRKLAKHYKKATRNIVLRMQVCMRSADAMCFGVKVLTSFVNLHDLEIIREKMSDFKPMALRVFHLVEVLILQIMQFHRKSETLQNDCMHLLLIMENNGFVSERIYCQIATPLFLRAMQSFPDNAVLQKHGIYVLCREHTVLRQTKLLNKRCVDGVLAALVIHPEDQEIVYAALTTVSQFIGIQKYKASGSWIQNALRGIGLQVNRLNKDPVFISDPRMVMHMRENVFAIKIVFAGLDFLCKVLLKNKNRYSSGENSKGNGALRASKNFHVAKVAYHMLLSMGCAIGPWDMYCDHANIHTGRNDAPICAVFIINSSFALFK